MVMAETFFTTKMRQQWMLVYFITYVLIILQWQAEDPSRIFNINILIVDFNVPLSSFDTTPHWTWPNCSSLHCQDCKAHEFGIILGTMKRRTFLPWNTLPKKTNWIWCCYTPAKNKDRWKDITLSSELLKKLRLGGGELQNAQTNFSILLFLLNKHKIKQGVQLPGGSHSPKHQEVPKKRSPSG